MTLAPNSAPPPHVGLLRSSNQDSGYAGPHLLVLADGMGGPAGGDIASSMAIAHLAPLDGESHGSDDMLDLLRDAVAEAHAELRTRVLGEPDLAGLGTTLIAMMRSGKRLAMVHIGDSRAYLARDGVFSRITTDHTYVQHLVDLGQLDPAEAENHPHRSVLIRVLGDHDLGVELDESVRELHAGDRFLLCSDGVSSFVSAETIEQAILTIKDPGACADHLVDLALRAGGPDNITAVIADVVELDSLADGTAPDTQPQVVGAAAAHWSKPTRGGSGAAARAAALIKGESAPTEGFAPSDGAISASKARTTRKRRRITIGALLGLLVLIAAGASGYQWTQTQHYVATSGDFVAIYRGIPQSIGPFDLSTVVETTDVRVDELPQFSQTRLEQSITPANATLENAQEIVSSLRTQVESDATATPTPTPSATPTPATTDPATTDPATTDPAATPSQSATS